MTSRPARESVVFVVPDKLGGMMNIVAHLLQHRAPDRFDYHAVLTHNALSTDNRFQKTLNADTQTTIEYRSPVENIHTVMRRLRRAIPPGGGVMVTNDLLELAMASAGDVGRTVMMLLHGDNEYYYSLAERHQDVIDVFICGGRAMYRGLCTRLPHRAESILHLPYGVPIPARARAGSDGPLRLLFAGRLVEAKGIYDLPLIDRALAASGTAVRWTIVGDGPENEAFRERWADAGSRVAWTGAMTNEQVVEVAARQDVLVLPTCGEGFPLAVLEAMAAGLVPVVSNIDAVSEVIEDGVQGFLCGVGDVEAMVRALQTLSADRPRLDAMSTAARQKIALDYDINTRVGAYQDLFARHASLKRPRPADTSLPYATRLDRPWIPNAAVIAVRTLIRRMQGRPA